MNFFKKALIPAVLFLFTSCSVSKHIKEDVQVHVKTEITFKNRDHIQNIKKVESEVLSLAQPKPAANFAKWQTKLYNKYSNVVRRDSTGKALGIRGWALRKIGLPPVIFDFRKVNNSRGRIQKYFNDKGYFGTIVRADTTVNKKEVTVNYTVYPTAQYHLRHIHFPKDSLELVEKIFTPEQKSLLISGAPYSQDDLNEERKRLVELANNLGFLHVDKDHFYFFVDTALGSRQVDIYLQLRPQKDSSVFQQYRLNQNIVFATYSLSSEINQGDTAVLDNFKIIQNDRIIRPKILADIIGGKKGELYSQNKSDDALTRLLDLGVYQFVNLKIQPETGDSTFWFNRDFYLTPGLMQDVSAEFESISRSTSYIGIAATLTYSHKNIFRGAERLDFSISGGIGTQTNTTEKLINTLDGTFEIGLTLPRLIPSFKIKGNKGPYIPKTRISIGNDYERRIEYYTVNTFIVKYGFEWAKSKRQQHQLYPVNINNFTVADITDEMRELFIDNPRLEKSFTDVFIMGIFYNYTFTTQTLNPTKTYLYLRSGIETSGNLANIIISTIGKQTDKPYTIANAPYSQYIRLDEDFRFYIPQKKGLLATRLLGGIGIPYKNSEVLPYIKQYFTGGPSSIRAFQFRALGPGTFAPPVTNNIDQTGDIRLEGNVEYRFPIAKYLKGALFVDAGNIWLLKDIDDTTPGGIFKFNTFYKEFGVGTGLGFREDLNFLVIRLDVAFPLRKPYLEDGNRWVISDIDFASKAWRQENIQWNFAIGYPF